MISLTNTLLHIYIIIFVNHSTTTNLVQKTRSIYTQSIIEKPIKHNCKNCILLLNIFFQNSIYVHFFRLAVESWTTQLWHNLFHVVTVSLQIKPNDGICMFQNRAPGLCLLLSRVTRQASLYPFILLFPSLYIYVLRLA